MNTSSSYHLYHTCYHTCAFVSLLLAGCFLFAATVQAACEPAPFRDRIDRTLASLQESGRSQTEHVGVHGRLYTLIDVGISGMLDGCVVLAGPIPDLEAGYSWLYDVPDVSLPQEHLLVVERTKPFPLPISPGDGNTHERHYVTGSFRAEDGSGIQFTLPTAGDWNGKLFIVQHGSGVYSERGPLLLAEEDPGAPFPSGSGRNLFADVFAASGYAVASLRRDAIRPPKGVSTVKLENGRELSSSFVAQVAYPLALTEYAQRFVHQHYGSPPPMTYYYGHSGGGITGRLINQAETANRAHDGTPIIDGFLLDDAGNGLYLPVAFRDGKDVLFTDAAARAQFTPQIEIARQLYNPVSYLTAKRMSADLLRLKGLGERSRYYEIAGSSHMDAGMTARYLAGDDPEVKEHHTVSKDVIDLSGMITGFAGLLDQWVSDSITPPPSAAALSGYAATLVPPEVTCPLGVHYAPRTHNGATTLLAVFDEQQQEPELEQAPGYLDMNGNGIRDRRESLTGAWRRLGLLAPNQQADEDRYANCLREAASELIKERFLPAGSDAWYFKHASLMWKMVQH